MEDRKAYMKVYNHTYYQNNKEKEKERAKKYALSNPEKVKQMRKNWWKNKGKTYREDNIEKIRISANKYNRKKSTKLKRLERKKTDPVYWIRHLLRSRIGNAIKRQYGIKSLTTIELIGCSIEECRKHLEGQFKDGMTWENQGEWHIDHIYPLSKFDLTNQEEQKKAFHYTNLQPLFAKDNIRKGNKIITG